MEKRRHGDTEKRRNGEAVTQNKNANRFLRITLYAFTHYTQPIFGANAPPTQPTTFYALRFTLHASRFTPPFSKFANFAVKSVKSRITNHASDGYQMTPEVVII